MGAEILRESIREHQRWLLWWCFAIAAFIFINLVFYPSIRDSAGLADYSEQLPKAMRALFVGGELDLTSPVGFLNSQIFALLAPILFTVFAVGAGATTLAGDEEQGALDLLLAQPVSRGQVIAQRFLWLVLATVVLTLVTAVTVIAGSAAFDLEISAFNVLAASVSTGLFGLLFGAIAMASGAIIPGRARAISIAAGAATAAWVLDGLARTVDWLSHFQWTSPYHLAFGGSPLANGAVWGDWAALIAMTAVVAMAGFVGLRRRDVRQ